MRILPYSLLDVFAERPLAGNPLAVFTDARALSTQEMQALALETFAGHPTLGTATWLHLNHPVYRGATRIVLDLSVGHIPVDFEPLGPEPGVVGSMRQNDPHFGQMHLPGAIADALGLNLDDLDPTLPIQTVSTGLPFCIVPLRSLEVAHRLAIPQHRALQYLAATDAKFFHCVTRSDHASGTQWHARMQFYNGEDPATGSASGCLAAYLVQHSLAASGQSVLIEQGVEMLRPSRILVHAEKRGQRVTEVCVGGRTIPIAEGRVFLPHP
jgi:trans-2,3-dihydro-3-hydroxyanthranilate isomerase